MGKGDKKTKKGKIALGSFGVSRPKLKKKKNTAPPKPKAAAKPKAAKAEKALATEKPKAAKKPAAKKPAKKKEGEE